MKFYDVTFFIDKDNPIVPTFNRLDGESGPTFRLGTDGNSYHSQVTIFFDSVQSATNFKNEVIQSFETFLRRKSGE